MDVLFIGAVMNYDGAIGSPANYIRTDGKWVAPFQYVHQRRPELFASEGDACVYSVPNLSICKLVDYLRRRIDDLSFHVVWHFDYRREEVLDILRNSPPRLVAISTTLAFYPQYLNDCVAWLNAHKQPETKVVLGGKWIYDRYKTLAPAQLEEILVQADADYYVINGYGEETLYRLLRAEMDGDVAGAQGLASVAYRRSAARSAVAPADGFDGKHYRINPVVQEDQVPGRPMIDFSLVGEGFLGDVVHVRTASSCPFKCNFCTFPVLQGEHVLFDLDAVMQQLRQLKDMGVKSLFFIDDTFNVPRRRFDDLMTRMIAARLGFTWVSFFRSQYADADLVQKMYDAGCRMVFCGFESGNDAILKSMDKHVKVSQYEAGLEYLDRAGIEVLASYIVGYPGETYATAMDTLRLVNHPRVRFSRGSLFYYELNAPVARRAAELGLSGCGAEWRHNTMNSREAARIHLEMIDKLRGVNVPVSDGGGWNLFYLFAKGLPFEEQETIFRDFNAIQRRQIAEAGTRVLDQYRAFAKRPRRKRRGVQPAEPAETPDMSF